MQAASFPRSAPRLHRIVVPAFLATVVAGWFLPGAAGDWGLFLTLGVFPGVALAALLPIERGAFARWTLGLAVSPLVTTLAAWALMRAGLSLHAAAVTLAIGWTAVWAWTEWRAGARDQDDEGGRFAWAWALGAAAVVAIVMSVNPFLQVRGDAWVHAGIIWEIIERGIPPQDPRFAGLTLNYVWFHNYFVALLTTLKGGDPFRLMAIANVASMFATMGLGWLIGRAVWDSPRAAAGAAVLMGLAFNAAVWLTWPLRFLKVWTGEVRGDEEVIRQLMQAHWNDSRVLLDVSMVYGYMVNFLDKLLHGTAINVAYGLMLVALWAMVRALKDGAGAPALAWGAAAASGMLFFHGVVGLSVIPVILATLALAWLLAGRLPWLPPRGRLVAFAAATLAGMLVAAPYTIAISRAWPAAQSGLEHTYVKPDPAQWITLAFALAVAAWFARRAPARIVAERRGPAAVLGLFVACMLAFSSAVTLPIWSHSKFVFEAFVGVAVLGGAFFHAELAAWRRRLGLPGAVALFAVLLASTPLLTIRGFLLERGGDIAPETNPVPGEEALYAWMRERTPHDAVFVDNEFRYLIMVKGRRQLYLGSALGPELAAFPMAELTRRREVMADLYGPGIALEQDAARLAEPGRPAFVLVRGGDPFPDGPPTARLDARPDLFTRVYDRDGFVVYAVRTTAASASATRVTSPSGISG